MRRRCIGVYRSRRSGGIKMNYNVSIREGIEELGIFKKNSDAWVSTRNVARLFDKDHRHIMETIRNRILPDISEEFNRSNFRLVK